MVLVMAGEKSKSQSDITHNNFNHTLTIINMISQNHSKKITRTPKRTGRPHLMNRENQSDRLVRMISVVIHVHDLA